jgi:hypothetical protein
MATNPNGVYCDIIPANHDDHPLDEPSVSYAEFGNIVMIGIGSAPTHREAGWRIVEWGATRRLVGPDGREWRFERHDLKQCINDDLRRMLHHGILMPL